jgi:epoxyqueuosine reductase QueG
VRSKFQTKRRLEDAKKGIFVEVPFDNTTVKFFWKDERVLEVVDIVRTTDDEQRKLIEDLQREEQRLAAASERERAQLQE